MMHLFQTETGKRAALWALIVLLSQPVALFSSGKRTLRYSPEGTDLVIINGERKFNKALYGTNTAFRVEAGDKPEFGLFMPNMGGNISFRLFNGERSISLNDCSFIRSIYRSGSYLYEIKDDLLGNGQITLTVLAMGDAEGIVFKLESRNTPAGSGIVCTYGGANDKRFFRNGDLGVDDPEAFALKKENCAGNKFDIRGNAFTLSYGKDGARKTCGVFPENAKLETGKEFPVLISTIQLQPTGLLYIAIKKEDGKALAYPELGSCFDAAEKRRSAIAGTIEINTPDPYLNPIGGLLATAADGIWDEPTQSWQHGAIGWRMPLNGWRGAYAGDVMGWHDRARQHFDGYAASQITDIPPTIGHPAQDSALALARAEKSWGTPMYSNGYICRNPRDKSKMHHYDMNLCYIDELLWHFNWTGDMEYVRQMWPVLQRHLAWEKLNFDPDGDGLYNAYACIWASDALQYSGGGVTHSSAYNYRANKMAAAIAEKLGEDPAPYQQEADKIYNAIRSRLWQNETGVWAEFVDLMGNKTVHPVPGLWTIYHAIDSEVHSPFQAYQATRFIDNEIPHIPLKTEKAGELDDNYAVVSTTNWFPYSWSVNNVAFAEIAHTSLAYWQAGRYEEACKLFKSAVLDGMYMGGCPGNIGQISHYDAARGECYRDFADPVGMYGRAVVQGLFGILPDRMNKKVRLQPGFPASWDHASIKTSYIHFDFKRKGNTDQYRISRYFDKDVTIDLLVKGRKDKIKSVRVNQKKQVPEIVEGVGNPIVRIACPADSDLDIRIEWEGNEIKPLPSPARLIVGDQAVFNVGRNILEVYDPQQALGAIERLNGSLKAILLKEGQKTFFLKLQSGDMNWWQAVDIEVRPAVSCLYDPEDKRGSFSLKNERSRPARFRLVVNPGSAQYEQSISLPAGAQSSLFPIPSSVLLNGNNRLLVFEEDKPVLDEKLYFPEITQSGGGYETVDMTATFNAFVTDIFRNEYLSPRSPYTTLQIPKQGIGEWCHPLLTADIDDSGFRQSIREGVFHTPQGTPFLSPADTARQNILFTSLWDNYPELASLPLQGKARQARLLMAGSTNHIQCHVENGSVTVFYKDGSSEKLALTNPDTWAPIEQDLYIDDYAFRTTQPRAPRVVLKTGLVSRNLERDLNIKGVYGRSIPGGGAILLDMPLDNRKKLDRLELKTAANEVVIGLMAVTLLR